MTAIEIPTPDPRTLDDVARPFAEAIAERYAVKKVIGRGGMGIVYLVRDRRLDRLAAVKTLLPELAADPAVRERFLRETRTAGAMSHPNVVPIHGADEVDGHVFFVMGYVDGDSLATHVRANGTLEPRMVASVMRDVAGALSHAHQRGIIHRDVKAENILLDRQTGRALVTDFGIARLAEAAPLTATGQMLGTVYYVSPEQVSGESIDARSDLYSLGVVGFLALTGRFPFEAELASAVLVAHVTRNAPPVASVNPNVPASLAAVVDRCLAKNPADRFASADELLATLDTALASWGATAAAEKAPLLSETRAQAIWKRAAELQAMTGTHGKIPLEEVRAAANEAGIGEKYLAHALAEQGIGATRALAQRTEPRRSFWAGVPLRLEREVIVDREIHPREFDGLINTLRDRTEKLGTTLAKARELAWRCGTLGSRLDVSVIPDAGQSTVRVSLDVKRAAMGRFAGTIVVVGMMVGPAVGAIMESIMEMPAPSWGFHLAPHAISAIAAGLGSLVGLSSIPLARKVVRRMVRRADARLADTSAAVASKVLRSGES